MEQGADKPVETTQIVLKRRDIVNKTKRHKIFLEQMLSDCNLILETFNAANKKDHTEIVVRYSETLLVLEDVRQYLEDCMTVGVANTIAERQQSNEKEEV